MRKVLVVEDEVLIRLTLVDALHEAGFDVLDTGSAEHAIEIINEQTIHLAASASSALISPGP